LWITFAVIHRSLTTGPGVAGTCLAGVVSGFDFDRRTVGLLAAVLAAAIAATVFFTRGPTTSAAPAVAPVVQVTASALPSTTPQGSPPADIVVEVVGKVREPQVLTLPKGSRVIDALDAVGGARAGVDTSDQNLARVLVDGEQIRIGLDPAPVGAGAPAATGAAGVGVIDINTATVDVLDQIPGVGPVLAQRIIAYRDLNGGFTSVDQLMEVSGIGEATFAEMQPMVTVGNGG
jgi:competence protein ComEA